MVQWLGLCTVNAGDMGSIPGWGTKILYAVQHNQKIFLNYFNEKKKSEILFINKKLKKL